MSAPAVAGDLGTADLSNDQLADALPPIGYTWEAWCGNRSSGQACKIKLGENELIVNDALKISYSKVIRSESFNTWTTPGMERGYLVPLIRNDPAYTGWSKFKRGSIGGNISWNTILVEYVNSAGSKSVALFAFAENRESWQALSHTLRLVSYGARPKTEIAK